MHTFTHTHPYLSSWLHLVSREKLSVFSTLLPEINICSGPFHPPLSAHLTNCEQLMLARFWNQTVWKLTRWLQLQVFLFSFYSSCLFFCCCLFHFVYPQQKLNIYTDTTGHREKHSRQRYFCVLLLWFGFIFFFAWFLCVTHLHKWKNFTFVCCYLWLLVWFTDLFS